MGSCYSAPYRLQRLQGRFERLKKKYEGNLMERFRKSGDINLFMEFDQELYNLRDDVEDFPTSEKTHDEVYELFREVNSLIERYNSLLHSA